MTVVTGAVTGSDGVARCPWPGLQDPLYRRYHDEEWGRPVHGEQPLLERLCLEAFQSGLSWLTILRKRPAFRVAFAGFDPQTLAGFTERDVERLLGDAGIVRNRRKIEATVTNARATLALREHGGLEQLVWSYADADRPRPASAEQVPARTAGSTELAARLRRHGFAQLGPVTVYAAMQACGLVDDHVVGCHRSQAA